MQGRVFLKSGSKIGRILLMLIDADSTIQGCAALKVRSTINGGVGINTALSIPVARANVKFHMLDGIEEISSTHE